MERFNPSYCTTGAQENPARLGVRDTGSWRQVWHLEESVRRVTAVLGWKFFDEAIVMLERRYQYFPCAFVWRGHHFRVVGVNRCWTRSRRGWRGPGRNFFQVRCSEGTFEVYQETHTTNWYLRRANLDRERGRVVASKTQGSIPVCG
jgi:hypothetical protein